MADGRLIFDTKVDESGLDEGVKNIASKMKETSSKMKNAFDVKTDSKGIQDKAAKLEEVNKKIEAQKKKIADLNNQMEKYNQYNTDMALLKEGDLGIEDSYNLAKKYEGVELPPNVTNELQQANAELNEMYSIQKRLSGNPLKNIIDVSSIKNGLSSVIQGFNKLSSSIKNGVGKSIKTAFSKFKQFFSSNQKGSKDLLAGLTRISTMLKARLIRSIVSGLINGLKQGFQNLVQYSSQLNKSFSGVYSSLTQLKNSIATAFAPVLEKILPIIQSVINKIIEMNNIISQFTASLFGNATTFTKASKVSQDYAKSLSNGSKASSKMLANFDTIQKLDNKESGSSEISVQDMFEKAEIDSSVIDFTSKLKDAIANEDWMGLGAIFGEKLNEMVANIDAQKLAKKISDNINKAFAIVNGFLNMTNFEKIGQKVAEFLNTGITNIDWTLIGYTLGSGINAVIDTLYGFVTSYNWGSLAKGIADSLNMTMQKIDWKKAGQTLSTGIRGIFKEINTFMKEFDWMKLGRNIAEYIMAIDWLGLIGDIVQFIVNKAIAGFEFLAGIAQVLGEKIGMWIYDQFYQSGEFSWKGFTEGIVHALYNLGEWIFTNVINPVIAAVKNGFGIHSPSTVFAEIGGYLIEGLKNGIVNGIESVKTAIIEIVEMIKNKFKGITDYFKNGFKTDLQDGFKKSWNSVLTIVKEVINKIIGFVNSMINAVEKAINIIVDKINDLVDATNELNPLGDWIPRMKRASFGRIPYLASGTVVPQNANQFMAVLGDNKQETEVVSPLSTMKQALLEALNESNGMGGNQTVILELNGEELGRVVYKLNKKESKRIGTSLRLGGAY